MDEPLRNNDQLRKSDKKTAIVTKPFDIRMKLSVISNLLQNLLTISTSFSTLIDWPQIIFGILCSWNYKQKCTNSKQCHAGSECKIIYHHEVFYNDSDQISNGIFPVEGETWKWNRNESQLCFFRKGTHLWRNYATYIINWGKLNESLPESVVK